MYEITPSNFDSAYSLVTLFVEQGYMTSEEKSSMYESFEATVHDFLVKGVIDQTQMHQILVDLMWMSVVMTKKGGPNTPYFAYLCEKLYFFDRPEKPLTPLELKKLHQIDLHIQTQIGFDRMPAELENMFPAHVSELAQKEFHKTEVTQFPEVHKSIIHKLNRLRVNFKENCNLWASEENSYIVDFKI